LSETAWKLSDGLKLALTTVPWPLIAGMQHRLVHDYGRTDDNVVYQVATVHLPKLIEQVRTILAQSGSPTA
jgi:uncharacterized protein with HEPN domain